MRLPDRGEVSCSIFLLLEICETCSSVKLTILVKRTVPLSVGEVSRGFADVAGEGPEHRTGHQAGFVLQFVAPVLSFRFSIREAKVANTVAIHILLLEIEINSDLLNLQIRTAFCIVVSKLGH